MKKTTFLGLLLVSAFLTSCAAFNPNIKGEQHAITQVSLSSANFRVVSFVQGSATATYIMGIGGLNKKGLVASSKAKMMENADLKGAQCIINEHTEWKTSAVIPYFWGSTTVTTSGTIIEFTK
jgi:hypothetical protein